MFNIKKKFKFLEDGIDFPFYNDIPKLSTIEWAILVIVVVIFIILASTKGIPKIYHALLYFLVMTIPAIYICKGNYSLFFKKPKLRDFKTIIICFILYYIYSIGMGVILQFSGYPVANNANSALNLNLMFFVSLFIQLVGEEFFKIFVLLILMYIVYRFTNNRSLSMYTGIIGTLVAFGLIHSSAYSGRILQILLIQGLGTIFNLYAYMKTKNFVVSYILHILIDLSTFLLQTTNHMLIGEI